MPKGDGQQQPQFDQFSPFSNPEQTTGFHDDASGFSFWDPNSRTIQFVGAGEDPVATREALNLGYYENVNGDYVYGLRPDDLHYDSTKEVMVVGKADPVEPHTGPLSLGDVPYSDIPPTGGSGVLEYEDDGSEQVGDNDRRWDVGRKARIEPIGAGGAYDWNWTDLQPGATGLDGGGGYDPNDYAFERYVPGQESPWGVPEVEGGNKDFYRNQFLNLLREEQGFSEQQRDSYAAREYAENNPVDTVSPDWAWLDGGLPDPFRQPYGATTEEEGFGYSTDVPKYILNPTRGKESMYVTNPSYDGGASGPNGNGWGRGYA